MLQKDTQSPNPTFRFFDLPSELRQIVYKQHFGSWDITVQHDTSRDNYRLIGFPPVNLIQANRQIYEECRSILKQTFSGKLILQDAKTRPRSGFGFQSSLEVVATLGIDELLHHVHTVTVEGGTTGMLALLPWHKLPSLRVVELENCFTCNPYSTGLVTQIWPFEASEEDNGTCQICGVHGWSSWTQVPDCVSEGRVRVVSVKRGFFSGACFRAVVEHKADRGEFVERVYECGIAV